MVSDKESDIKWLIEKETKESRYVRVEYEKVRLTIVCNALVNSDSDYSPPPPPNTHTEAFSTLSDIQSRS